MIYLVFYLTFRIHHFYDVRERSSIQLPTKKIIPITTETTVSLLNNIPTNTTNKNKIVIALATVPPGILNGCPSTFQDVIF